LIGSQRAGQVPLGHASCFPVASEHRDDGAVFAIELVGTCTAQLREPGTDRL
jgi:hypothetical protein